MTKAKEFKVGDKAVYPAHGVGEITDIMTRKLGGQERQFYTLKVLENGMKIMVPVTTAAAAGLRPIVSSKEAKEVFDVLKSDDVAVKTQPWNRRYREYMDMLKSGSPFEVAKVLRDLYRLKFEKELSFGERRLLDTANTLLIVELSLALEIEEGEIKQQVEEIFAA
ncbi:MAG: CarD family transcriptional regulator [Deltaproteobacteria bacterium]|nr:CarD family transcriptional regulator [Deltaproteobacteria bacterium]